MKHHELRECRHRLGSFLEPILARLGREERRRWGAFYVQAVLMEGGRKTAAGMAARYGGNEQALQQFLSQSPWEWRPVRAALAEAVLPYLSPRCGWVVDDTGFPKKGTHSVGVHRQYSGTLGKIGNCQIGVSLNYATDEACVPLDFALYLPEAWTNDPDRCRKAGIPEDVAFKTKWELALDMIERARGQEVPQGVIIADAGYGHIPSFRRKLREQELSYVLAVQSTTLVWPDTVDLTPPPYQGRGRPRKRRVDLPRPRSVLEIAQEVPEAAWQEVTWRQGSKGPLKSRFAAVKVQPTGGRSEDAEPLGWLLIEWPAESNEPLNYWVSNLLEETTLRELVSWAKLRWYIEQNYQQLKDQLGIDHFEGRSWTGWHHHVTLTMMAFDFLVLETLRVKKNFWVDAAAAPTRNPAGDPGIFRFLSAL